MVLAFAAVAGRFGGRGCWPAHLFWAWLPFCTRCALEKPVAYAKPDGLHLGLLRKICVGVCNSAYKQR